MEQRRFHRINISAKGELSHHEITYNGRLQNISLRGAMLTSEECIMVPVGDCCTLSFFPDREKTPLLVTVQVVHAFFSMVGVKFIDFPEGAELRLYRFLQTITREPEQLRHEWEVVLGHGTPPPCEAPPAG